MKMYNISEENSKLEFAKKAAAYFEENPHAVTYLAGNGKLEAESYIALRWGMGDDCVVVAKICSFDEATNYTQIISRKSGLIARKCQDVAEKLGKELLQSTKEKDDLAVLKELFMEGE